MGGERFKAPAPNPRRTCLGCREWDPQGTREWAARMGLAQCVQKQTQAHVLAHWRTCELFAAASAEEVQRRLVWLRDGGLYRKVLSGPVQSAGPGS